MNSIDDGPEGTTRSYAAVGPIHSPNGWGETVQLYVANNAPEIVVEATLAVVDSWNLAAGTEILSYEGRTAPANTGSLFSVLEDTKTIIYFERNWSRNTGKSDYVLGTTVWENSGSDGRSISRGDIILNGESFYFQDAMDEAEDPDRYYDIADCESVLLHEAGHLLGIDHVDELDDEESVMHTTTPIGQGIAKRQLSQGDADLIRQIYSGGN